MRRFLTLAIAGAMLAVFFSPPQVEAGGLLSRLFRSRQRQRVVVRQQYVQPQRVVVQKQFVQPQRVYVQRQRVQRVVVPQYHVQQFRVQRQVVVPQVQCHVQQQAVVGGHCVEFFQSY